MSSFHTKSKVLLVDTVHSVLREGLLDFRYALEEDYTSPKQEIIKRISEYSGLVIRSRFKIDQEFLDKATQLQFIARVGAGLENIDVSYAQSKGIKVLSAAEGNRDAVGEHVIGMLLTLFNRLSIADREVRDGLWKREENRGHELQGKTVGIIGLGQMGSAFAEKLKGFGVTILAYDKYKKGYSEHEASLEELKVKSDIISLHLPENDETYHYVNEAFIDSIDKPFYLVNTARGKNVKTKALVEGLESGRVLGACLDVLEYEKSSFENLFDGDVPKDLAYLLQSEKTILTPHIAGWTHESNKKMAEMLLTKIKDFS